MHVDGSWNECVVLRWIEVGDQYGQKLLDLPRIGHSLDCRYRGLLVPPLSQTEKE